MVSGTTGATYSAGSTITEPKNNQLDKEAFLKLLITQLQNQNPLKPMDDKEFIAQLAQFSSLEQMQTVNKNLDLLNQGQMSLQQGTLAHSLFQQAIAVVGKNIEFINPDYKADSMPESEKNLTGKVDSVDFRSGVPVLHVGDTTVPLEYVLSVSDS